MKRLENLEWMEKNGKFLFVKKLKGEIMKNRQLKMVKDRKIREGLPKEE